MIIRKKCKIVYCDLLCAKKGERNGTYYYRTTCQFHRNSFKKRKKTDFEKEFLQKQKINNKKCEICGWKEGPCDRHKIYPSKGYIKSNVKILCPNCHRLVTLKIIKI